MRLIHRFIVTALSLSLALLLITPIASAQNSFDLHVDAMNSSISIEEDGVVNITEEVKVTFLEEFHGIYRYIPYIYSTSDQELYTEITVHQVLRNGADERFKEDRENGNVELKIGNPDQTISGTHTYTISYTAKGILRSFDGYDEFYWNVTGEDWEMPINEVQATVTLPKPGIL